MPDIEDREGIIKIHARGKPFVKGISWNTVAKRTVGFSGADLENMLNEAAILAARENKRAIDMSDIEEAATKVKLGPEKKRLQSKKERKMTAYHEAGHAVVTYFQKLMDPVHRISIVSRGLAMGFTLIPPKKDRYNETRSHLKETITSLLGGRAAEELIFDEFTAGAASDIDKGTRIARRMVVDFGMSDLGPVYLGPQIETTEWGRTWFQPTEISPEMQAKVDAEIKRIIDAAYKKSLMILKKNKKKLDEIAEKLLDQETIEAEEFEALMKPTPKIKRVSKKSKPEAKKK
jgi:cell division protease FtsH